MSDTRHPCKGCTARRAACHGSCEAYKQWRAAIAAYNARTNAVADDFRSDSIYRG